MINPVGFGQGGQFDAVSAADLQSAAGLVLAVKQVAVSQLTADVALVAAMLTTILTQAFTLPTSPTGFWTVLALAQLEATAAVAATVAASLSRISGAILTEADTTLAAGGFGSLSPFLVLPNLADGTTDTITLSAKASVAATVKALGNQQGVTATQLLVIGVPNKG